MIRRAEIKDIPGIIDLLHQVDMVHHVLRPDLFKPNTTKYNEQELEDLLGDDSKPIFVFEDGTILGHAFCMITEVKGDKLLEDIKTLYIDDICVDEKARGKHVGKALYEFVRDYAKSIGCNNITLNVWDGNDPALSFYRNMGMKVQKTTMEILLILAGADALICHHTHTLQTIETFRGKPIYYSIGNFIFDPTHPINAEACIVRLKITSDTINTETLPVQIRHCVPYLKENHHIFEEK